MSDGVYSTINDRRPYVKAHARRFMHSALRTSSVYVTRKALTHCQSMILALSPNIPANAICRPDLIGSVTRGQKNSRSWDYESIRKPAYSVI